MRNLEIRNDPRSFRGTIDFKRYLLKKTGQWTGVKEAELQQEERKEQKRKQSK